MGGGQATSRAVVAEFLAQKQLALVGLSRSGRKFGNVIHRELKAKGYTVYAVHREAAAIGGERCWPALASLPEPVGGVVLVVPPAEAEKLVAEARAAGIGRVWMQQGSQSPAAVRYCEENGMACVPGECILMFAEPAGLLHRVHRGLWGLLGRLPR